ncbi:MAG: nucleotidyl transferase AbiEii/AbiGii toxin family protein [Verrucomicrobiota bacterium]
MTSIDLIKSYYPAAMAESAGFQKHLLKEYVQLLTLDFLSATKHVRKLTFIGGTNLRLVKSIDRFSEDLDFDCKELSEQQFVVMADDVQRFLERSGFQVETRERQNKRLTAFQRNLYFPELLFEMGLSGHRNARFLLKLEAQDQQVAYETKTEYIKGCGFFFPFPVPTDAVMCSMKIAAMLGRHKGRDYYDAIFLLSQTEPDYSFLAARCGIHDKEELKTAVFKSLEAVDLRLKQHDFEHLLFHRENSRRILNFAEFIRAL